VNSLQEGWQLREEEDTHHSLFEAELVTLEGVHSGGITREEVAAKCGALEQRRRLRDPASPHWSLAWIDKEPSGHGKEDKQERLDRLEEWGEEVLKVMRRAHASVECPGKWYDEWRTVEEKLDAITWELQAKLLAKSQVGIEEEYLEDCGKKWVELLRQGERLYPIWPREARDEAATALLTALDQSWTAENGSRERREWWAATKNWKKKAVSAIKRNLRIKEGPRRSSRGWAPHEVLDDIVGSSETSSTLADMGGERDQEVSQQGSKGGNPTQDDPGNDRGGRKLQGRNKCWDRGKSS
jgi:hypothetical protein